MPERTHVPALLLVPALLVACGGGGDGSDGSVASIDVGTEAVTATLPCGGALSLAAGAVPVGTTLTVACEAAAPVVEGFVAAGPFYTFSPEGLTFAEPVTLVLPYDPTATPGKLGLAWSADGVEWEGLPSWLDEAQGTVGARLRHFSSGGVASWEEDLGACCLDRQSCGPTAREDCPGVFVDPGTDCESACQDLECCAGEDGPEPAVPGRCAADGRTVLPWTHCEPELVCCASNGDYRAVPWEDCRHVDDEIVDRAWCDEVCCQENGASAGAGGTLATALRVDCLERGGEP